MNKIQPKNVVIFALLAALMLSTRLSHFGSTLMLPDASLAIFFLGGMFLARSSRLSIVAFLALIVEAGLIDYYATSVLGVSDWCFTPAYWFLIPTYGSLWMVGRWFSLNYSVQGKGMVILVLAALAVNSFAFMFSNVTFYLFSDLFTEISFVEYAASVSQYYVSYVSVAMLYIACAVAMQVIFQLSGKQHFHPRSDIA
ncbi:MAG: hypothetical protein R8M11_04870 [Gallionella sp.]